VYQHAALRETGDGLIRPGGLELTQKVVAMSALCPGSLVLDIGCGTGATLRYLTESCALRAIGIDLSSVLLAEGQGKNPRLLLARASGLYLPFTDAIMDAVLAECSLSLMEHLDKVLDECSRVLKPGGLLLVHDVYIRNPPGGAKSQEMPVGCCPTGAVSREEWTQKLEGRGFAVTFWEDHSRALKIFAAQLIFSHGSLETFLSRSPNKPSMEECREIQHAASSSAAPGYFLAVAKKTDQE
jgi:SAM-dependent methyltransferase